MSDGFTPPGQRSFSEIEEQRVEAIQDEEQRREEAKENEAVTVDEQGNIDAKNPDRQGVKTDKDLDGQAETSPGVALGGMPGDFESGKASQIRNEELAEQKQTQLQQKKENIREASSNRFQTSNGNTVSKTKALSQVDQQIQQAEKAEEQARQNQEIIQSNQKNREQNRAERIKESREQAEAFIERQREQAEEQANQQLINRIGPDQQPAMTSPGEEVNRLDAGLGKEFPDIGQQEFASGTENINADFREERDFETNTISEDKNAVDLGVFTGKSTSEGLQSIGVGESQADFFGTQTGKIATIVGGSFQGLSQIDDAAISLIQSPGKSVEKFRQESETDAIGKSASEVTDADILQGMAASNSGVSSRKISQGVGDAQLILGPASVALGSSSILRRADDFALRSPVKKAPNPTPDIEGVKQLDEKLELQKPVERDPDANRIEASAETETVTVSEAQQGSPGPGGPITSGIMDEVEKIGESVKAKGQKITAQAKEGRGEAVTFRDLAEGNLPDRAQTPDEIQESFSEADLLMGRNVPEIQESAPTQEMTRTEFLQDVGVPSGKQPEDLAGKEFGASTTLEQVEDVLTNTRKGQLGTGQKLKIIEEDKTPDTDTDVQRVSLSDEIDKVEDNTKTLNPSNQKRRGRGRDRRQRDEIVEVNKPVRPFEDIQRAGLTGIFSSQNTNQASGQSQGLEEFTGQDQEQGQGLDEVLREEQEKVQDRELVSGRVTDDDSGIFDRPDRTRRKRRDFDRTRTRRNRDVDLGFGDDSQNIFSEEATDDNVQASDTGFTPSLDALLKDKTVSADEFDTSQTFTGFETRPIVIEKENSNRSLL